MKIKKFDQDLHDKYDPPARAAVSAWLKMKWGYDTKDNPDKYGTDLIMGKNGIRVGFAEVEVRQWSPTCPFDTIHVPMRKKHMLEVPKTLFFALTQDMTHAYWIQMKDIEQYPVKEISNYKIPRGEMFFDIPIDKFIYVDLQHD